MSVIEAIDAYDKLELDDLRSFAAATALLSKSVQNYNEDPSKKLGAFQLLFESEYVESEFVWWIH